MSHFQRDGLPRKYFPRYIQENSIAQFSSVVEPDYGHWNLISTAEVLKYSLSSEATQCVFSNRMERITFHRATATYGGKAIDVPCRKNRDAPVTVPLTNKPRHNRIHCPGKRLLPSRSKLHTRHEDEIWSIRQLRIGFRIQQIAAMGLQIGRGSC